MANNTIQPRIVPKESWVKKIPELEKIKNPEEDKIEYEVFVFEPKLVKSSETPTYTYKMPKDR